MGIEISREPGASESVGSIVVGRKVGPGADSAPRLWARWRLARNRFLAMARAHFFITHAVGIATTIAVCSAVFGAPQGLSWF